MEGATERPGAEVGATAGETGSALDRAVGAVLLSPGSMRRDGDAAGLSGSAEAWFSPLAAMSASAGGIGVEASGTGSRDSALHPPSPASSAAATAALANPVI
ncbi:MAG: hypothetical protein Q4B08_01705 [Propionibacteriaceae bacterium]|nr:hypothetical protein [Propionibacteriaceae bacterium]